MNLLRYVSSVFVLLLSHIAPSHSATLPTAFAEVPEPTPFILFAIGLVALGIGRRRYRAAADSQPQAATTAPAIPSPVASPNPQSHPVHVLNSAPVTRKLHIVPNHVTDKVA